MSARVHLDHAHTHLLLKEMIRIRRFEEKCYELYQTQKIRGFLRRRGGGLVGIAQALGPEDAVVATYREHGQAIARGVPMTTIMAEMYGKVEGCSRGRGGSMHIFDRATRFLGGNAIVGGGLPLAIGVALGDKMQGKSAVTACLLARVARIQAQMIQSWDVLSTLTPADYRVFRHKLGPASGFQSHQYRLVEFLLGNEHRAKLAVHRHTPEIHAELQSELERPGLYDEAIRLLARRGFAIAPDQLERDWSRPYAPDASVRAAWRRIYRNAAASWDLYELAEELVDLEDWTRQWRFRHVTTVERIIGHKAGTGGSSGVSYLKGALEVSYFPELWEVRTDL